MPRPPRAPVAPAPASKLHALDRRLAAEPALVERVRAGDAAAVARLARLGGPALTRIAARRLGPRLAAHAPDVVQDVWREILAGRACFGERAASALAPWLAGVAIRHAKRLLRAEARRARRIDFAHERAARAPAGADDAAPPEPRGTGPGFGD